GRDLSVIGSHHRIEHPQRRCLARSVGTEQPGDRAVVRLEADVVDSRDRPEALANAGDAYHFFFPHTRDGSGPAGVTKNGGRCTLATQPRSRTPDEGRPLNGSDNFTPPR